MTYITTHYNIKEHIFTLIMNVRSSRGSVLQHHQKSLYTVCNHGNRTKHLHLDLHLCIWQMLLSKATSGQLTLHQKMQKTATDMFIGLLLVSNGFCRSTHDARPLQCIQGIHITTSTTARIKAGHAWTE